MRISDDDRAFLISRMSDASVAAMLGWSFARVQRARALIAGEGASASVAQAPPPAPPPPEPEPEPEPEPAEAARPAPAPEPEPAPLPLAATVRAPRPAREGGGWTDERTELLTKLWREGLSASQIAKELRGVTRNAVIGKAHRLGLTVKGTAYGRASASKPARLAHAPDVARAPNQNAGLAFKTRQFGISGNGTVFALPAEPRPPRFTAPGSAFSPLPGSTPRVWTERLSGMCCWPVGDEGQGERSCCLEVVARGWCSEHLRRGLAPAGITRRENARFGIVARRRAA